MINPTSELDSVQIDLITYQRTTDDYLSDHVISVAHLNDVFSGNQITFSLPEDTTMFYTATVTYFDYQDSLDYSWAGRLEDDGGYLVLFRKPDGITGFLQSPDYYYSIHPLGFEHAMLINKDLEYAEGFECSLDSLGFIQQAIDICDTDVNRCPAIIDVLSIVTDNAATWLNNNFGSIEIGSLTINLTNLYLELGYLTCNLALLNSAVPNKQFRFRTLFANIPLTTIIANDVNGMPNNDDILSWRDDYRADLVMALTNQNYGNTFGRAVDFGPNINTAFAITQIRFLGGPRYTLAHELAHLFGCRHNRPANGGNDNENNCAHGWQFTDSERIDRRTIMALSPALTFQQPGGREMHFSNPDVLINGVATGTINDDNARVFRNVGCEIANYRSQPEWSILFDTPEFVCLGDYFLPVCAHIIEPGTGFVGVAPYTITWEYYIDGGLPLYFLGDELCESITLPSVGEMLFIKLTVESDDNQTLTYWKIVTILDFGPQCAFAKPASENAIIHNEIAGNKQVLSVVYPNPTNGMIEIKISSLTSEVQNDFFSVKIFNAQGRLVKTLNIFQDGMDKSISLNLSGMPAGQYFAEVFYNSEYSYHKIIKL